MDSVDLSVLKTLREWQAGNLPLWLVTVVETFGSSPRPPGAMLALRGDGLAVGSVSGGCIEDELVLRAKRGELPADRCDVLSFGVTHEEAKRFRLPCGGVIRAAIETPPKCRVAQAALECKIERQTNVPGWSCDGAEDPPNTRL